MKLAFNALIDDAANDDDNANTTNEDNTNDNNNANNNDEVGGVVVVGFGVIVGASLTLLVSSPSLAALSTFFALVALVFIGPTLRVFLVRLKPNLENFSFIPLSKQVQTCSELALV